jgi:hypothetical protein
VPLHSVDEFKQLAPEELRSPEVLANEHQLMLNRLSFELTERQRYVRYTFSPGPTITLHRLDQKKRELIKQKEDLLRQSKAKAATTDSVKAQLETLIKVRSPSLGPVSRAHFLLDCYGSPKEGQRSRITHTERTVNIVAFLRFRVHSDL